MGAKQECSFNILTEQSSVFDVIAELMSKEYQQECTVEVVKIEVLSSEMSVDGKIIVDEAQELEAPDFPIQRVRLILRPGKLSNINAEVWLPSPSEWNGVLLGMGSGGAAGYTGYAGLRDRSAEGYVAAYNDLGTSKGTEFGENNSDMWYDFGDRGTHVMTVAAKAIIEFVYGCPADFAYFEGASTGGQQALREAQKYPLDYDGIIAGVPANNRTYLHTYFLWGYQHLYRGEDARLFTDEEIDNIYNIAVAHFKRRGDKFPDVDFICMPTNEDNTIDEILLEVRDSSYGLTEEQYTALKAMYEGPMHALTGEKIYDGVPFGGEYCWCGINTYQTEIDGLVYPFKWAFGNDYDVMTFDFGADFDLLNERVGDCLNANDPDLSEFFAHGGKLIMFSGSADACVPYHEAIKYYKEVLACCGGQSEVDKHMKYYIMPGREHGWTGYGVNAMLEDGKAQYSLLPTLRRWREDGTVPEGLQMARIQAFEMLNNDCTDSTAVDSLEDRIVFRDEVLPYRV